MTARVVVATTTAVAALGLVPGSAMASWTITQRAAEAYARVAAHQEYGVNRYTTASVCSPRANDPRGRYPPQHRWACGWADAHGCGGAFVIRGTTSRVYAFRYSVYNGIRCS
jgi:hypothetical protein